MPFLVLAYFFSYLDRVNLGFAALTMNAELKFTPLIFCLGRRHLLHRLFHLRGAEQPGAGEVRRRRWIARIMVTWGIISALMATVSGETSFYVLRFLLGVAEAGFFPGIILYLTYWYPAEYRARFLAAFAIAVPGLHRDRRADLGPAARARRRDGPEGLAVAVHHRGRSLGAARHRHLVLSHRPAGEGQLADGRAEGMAGGEAASRDRDQAGGHRI